jgi:GT2 family glycosyltransferase
VIDFSILIVNWNTKDYLIHCLESIFQKAKAPSWEVIVIDNGSQDGSRAEVRKRFPSIDLVENPNNVGFAKAMNQGVKKASGKYILLLNPDTEIKEGAFERLLAFMSVHPMVGATGAQLLNPDGSRQNSIANFPTLATELLNKSLLRWLFPKKFPGKGKEYPEPIEVDSVIGACLMVSRKAIEEIGFLDENYFLFLEETDWCYRMKKAGWKVYHIPEAEVIHFQGKSAEVKRERAKVEYFRSRYHFFKKHRGKLRWFILLTGCVIRLWLELILTVFACLVSGFSIRKWRRNLSTYAYLVWWHLRFCPEGMGLKK